MISVDDTVRPGVTLESLAKLKPVFLEDGASTAGNSSGIGDGAALTILTTRSRAEKEGWDIVGKYVASAFVGTYFAIMERVVPKRSDSADRRRTSLHGYRTCGSHSQGACYDWFVQGRCRRLGGAISDHPMWFALTAGPGRSTKHLLPSLPIASNSCRCPSRRSIRSSLSAFRKPY